MATCCNDDNAGGLGRSVSSMSSPSGASPRRRRTVHYTIDVLTDGSEWTGDGTLFLSVYRQPPLLQQPCSSVASPLDAATVDGKEDETNDDIISNIPRKPQYISDRHGNDDVAGGDEDDKHMRPAAPLARYAFPSLGDLTTRLAFDQRLSLAQTRAVFWSQAAATAADAAEDRDAGGDTTAAPRCRLRGLEGLPSLLINLKQAGAAQMTVVVGVDDDVTAVGGRDGDTRSGRDEGTAAADTAAIVQQVAALVARNTRTQMNLCSVPVTMGFDNGAVDGHLRRNRVDSSDSGTAAHGGCWWMVYRDDYVVVHAKRVVISGVVGDSGDRSIGPGCLGAGRTTVIYLFTMLQHPEEMNASLVVVSGQVDPMVLDAAFQLLPLVNDETTKIDWGISILNHSQSIPLDAFAASQHPNLRGISWFFTRPVEDGSIDPGLLVRAQQQSKAWHSHAPKNFPWNYRGKCEQDHHRKYGDNRLRTGWSLVLRGPQDLERIDRLERLKCGPNSLANRSLWPLRYSFTALSNRDENEILLDDDEHDDTAKSLSMQQEDSHCQASTTAPVELLALGTGCAAPSPYRGSSGYCLFLREDFTFVFETGEGFLTQWSRYSTRSLSSIRVIWISHAHYDHYGGLVSLLSRMHVLRRLRSAHIRQSSKKRQRTEYIPESTEPPVVLASSKILNYLNLMFPSPSQFFHGVDIVHEGRRASEVVCRYKSDRSVPSYPFRFFDTFRVNHSCTDSFGYILGLNRKRSDTEPFIICFSGDTRPCEGLVRACRRRAQHWNHGMIDLLIHEATFDNCEMQMSIAKKHSTIQEALEIGGAVRARKVFLTHFSQRYESPPEQSILPAQATPMFDGVLVQLLDD